MIHMRDKRAIILKNPKLQKIRNSLRDIIYQAAGLERKRSHQAWRSFLINSDGNRRDIFDLSPAELKEFRAFQSKEENLGSIIRRSILMCVSCGRGDQDMVYNKSYDAWYCTECYDLHHRHAKKRVRNQSQAHEDTTMDELSESFL